MDDITIYDAARLSINNSEAIKNNEKCSCTFCLGIYDSKIVRLYIDGGNTALCPRCGTDSVIAGEVDEKLLAEMFFYWHIDLVNDKHRHSIEIPRMRTNTITTDKNKTSISSEVTTMTFAEKFPNE